jgi:hypothetical protein
LLIVAGPAGAQDQKRVDRKVRWEVTFALRVPPAETPVEVRLALPADNDDQTVNNVVVKARGLKSEIVRDAEAPFVRVNSDGSEARRVAVSYEVTRMRRNRDVPAVRPLEYPPVEMLPYLAPAPLFQSRSILVREFLEENAAPRIEGSGADFLRPILAATRESLKHSRRGKSLTLDVLRSRRAKNIGIERAFCTFLRCARIPARFVEGADLRSSTSRKRVFWTEVWAEGAWWPVSASRGWVGKMPSGYVALVRDGRRVIEQEGGARVSYSVVARRIEVAEEPAP